MRNTDIENTNPYNVADGTMIQQRGNNPLAGIQSPKVGEEIARILGQIQVAKAFPRDMYMVNQDIQSSFARMKLAQEAVYTFSRGGTPITGPTIRTLEQIATCMQNINYGYEEIETNMAEHWTKIRCFAYDLERNTRSEINVTVSHKRTGKNQSWLTDPRDIYETVASQASRRIRSCLQRIIPEDIIETALECADRTIKQNINLNGDTIEKLCAAFKTYGVNKDMIEAFIQRNIAAITPDQYINLQRIWVSLRDGVAKVDDFFDISLSDNAKAAQKATEKPKKETAPKAAEKPVETQKTAPVPPADEPTAEDIAAMLNNGSPF